MSNAEDFPSDKEWPVVPPDEHWLKRWHWLKDEEGRDKIMGFADPEHWRPRDYIISMLAGPMAGIPVLRDLVDLMSGRSGSGPLSRVVNAGKAAQSVYKELGKDEDGTGADKPEVEKTEFYVKKIAQIAKGADAATAVGAHLTQQAFSIIDNLFDDEVEKERHEARAERRERKEEKEAEGD